MAFSFLGDSIWFHILQVTGSTESTEERVLTPTKTTICPAADLHLKKYGDKVVILESTSEQHSN